MTSPTREQIVEAHSALAHLIFYATAEADMEKVLERGWLIRKFLPPIPRPDLPRAWNPDGTPPAGEWEHAEYLGDYKGMTDVYHYDGEPTHRRWVGEWKTIEEEQA